MFYNAEKVRKDVIAACLKMKEEGLIVRTYGNISGRISDEEFVITPSGVPYEGLKPEDLVVVRIDDLSYEGEVAPSSEKGVHAAIYRNREEVGFVIHTHQQYATLLSTLGEDLPAPTVTTEEDDETQTEWKFFGTSVPCAKYGLNGSDKLIQAIEERVIDTTDSKAILMRNHGVLCFGKDRAETEDVVKSLEEMSRIIYLDKIYHWENQEEQPEIPEQYSEEGFQTDVTPYADLYKFVTSYPLTKRNAILSSLPATVLVSRMGKDLMPYLDDVAMTVGIQMSCLKEGASGKEILSALPEQNGAVLIEGHGAICAGVDTEEAKTVALLVEKDCLAALIENAIPVTQSNAKKEHKTYMDKYSKLARRK